MKLFCIGTLLAGSLAVVGCTPAGQPTVGTDDDLAAFKSIWPMDACDPPDDDVKGTVNIVLPNMLNGNQISRGSRVNYGTEHLPPNSPQTGQGPGSGTAPGWTANGPNNVHPFDVFMGDTVNEFGQTGYVQVRVIIRASSDWRFLVHDGQGGDSGIKLYGVGRNSLNDDTLCGVTPVEDNQSATGQQARYVATFFVNLAALYDETKPQPFNAPFTIGLIADETPILIDPKVWNDGA